MRSALWIAVCCGMSWACAEPSGGPTTPPPEGPRATPPPTPPTPPSAPPAVANPGRAPFELHAPDAPELASDPDARAWLELARAAFGSFPEGGFELRATPRDFFGVPMVQLALYEDPDGRSGHSYVPTALVRHHEGAWSFVHVVLDLPEQLPVQAARGVEDTHFELAACDREAQTAVLAIQIRDRNPAVLQRCQALGALIATTFLERAQGTATEMQTRMFLVELMRLLNPNGAGPIALRRSEVPRDVRWRSGASYVGWRVERQSDVLTASGTLLFERVWYRFALRAQAESITLELAILAAANSGGVPP